MRRITGSVRPAGAHSGTDTPTPPASAPTTPSRPPSSTASSTSRLARRHAPRPKQAPGARSYFAARRARVVADALAAAGADRMVVVDPHSTALEAMCGIPVEMLTAVPALASALAQECSSDVVVVAPDLGAVMLAEHYASLLERPVAVVRKTRVSGAVVRAEQMAGDGAGRPAVISDDMISTGATIKAAARVSPGLRRRAHGLSSPPHRGCWWEMPPPGWSGFPCGPWSPPIACRRATRQRRLYRLSPLRRCWPTPSAACTRTSRWGTCRPAPDNRRHHGGSGRRVDSRPRPGLMQGKSRHQDRRPYATA
jgi:Phosphoribosyl transferase domain